ncbi:putative nuclease HARBI1-like protein, partial [Dinothrombium tinctorium]
AEERYQSSHIKTRNIVERTFGAWKRKFFCLQSKLRLKLETSLAVIVACGVIWNFLKCRNEIMEDIEEENEIEILRGSNSGDSSGFAKRKSLINFYFNSFT